MKQLPAEEPFDLVFIDADKPSNPIYYKEARRLTRKGGVIVRPHRSSTIASSADMLPQIVDNTVRQGRVAKPEETGAAEEGVRVPAPSSDEEGTGWIFSETPGSAFAFFLSSSIDSSSCTRCAAFRASA